jgi:two-component system, NtrC family, response regulator AtoC
MATTAVDTFRLMVVSDDASLLRLLGAAAQSNAWHLETLRTGWDAMERVHSGERLDLAVLEIGDKDDRGLQLLLWLRRLHPDLPIAAICDSRDRDNQREATRMGAQEVLSRPVHMKELESLVRRNVRLLDGRTEPNMLSEAIESQGEDEFFLSVSPLMQKVRIQAELLAQTELPVLILGERGSGKGTVARLIHKLSVHAGFRFLRINCSEMPAELLDLELFGARKISANTGARVRSAGGALENGGNGTLLLDEITALPLSLQTKLFQVLQDRRLVLSSDGRQVERGIRILAASSDRVDRAIAEKRMDEGLYHRLSAFTINVPPVRQRKDEIDVLLRYSMHKLAKHYGLTPREFTLPILKACLDHSWPGNLEELQTFVKRYLVAGESELPAGGSESNDEVNTSAVLGQIPRVQPITPDAVRSNSMAPKSLKSLLQGIRNETEKSAIAAALGKTGWNRKAAARLLGVSYRTMLYKIDQYHMTAAESFVSSIPEVRSGRSDETKDRGKAH